MYEQLLKIKERKGCKTTLYSKIKVRRETGSSKWLIGAHIQNIGTLPPYLSIKTTQNKKRQRRVRRQLMRVKARINDVY